VIDGVQFEEFDDGRGVHVMYEQWKVVFKMKPFVFF
jgi:hypothetical protein